MFITCIVRMIVILKITTGEVELKTSKHFDYFLCHKSYKFMRMSSSLAEYLEHVQSSFYGSQFSWTITSKQGAEIFVELHFQDFCKAAIEFLDVCIPCVFSVEMQERLRRWINCRIGIMAHAVWVSLSRSGVTSDHLHDNSR